MKSRRIAVIALTGVALAAAGGGAIAATKDDPESAILNDAAKRLNVTPKALKDALQAAEDAQLDQQVKDGKLTQEQADRLKQRRDRSGRVLGGGPGFAHPGGPDRVFRGRFDHGGPGRMIDAAAKALGLSRDELFQRFQDGKTLADVAKAQGKDLADVKAAVRKSLQDELAQAVKDKRLTQERADKLLKTFDQRFDQFATRARPAGPRLRFHPGPGFHHGGPIGFDLLDGAATALGVSQDELFKALRDGKSLADIAKAQGKDLADVKAAVRKSLSDHLADAVKDKDLTQDRADDILRGFDDRFDELAQHGLPTPPIGPGGPGGPPDMLHP